MSFRGSERQFCFEWGSDVSNMFWTRVVEFEQINKQDGNV